MTPSENPGLSTRPGAVALLLRKEWLAFTGRDRLWVFGVFGLATLQTVFLDEAFFLLAVALAVALAMYVPVVEWYQETNPMLHSLPVGRNAVVVARYMVALIAGGVAGIAWAAAGQILLPILVSSRTAPGMWMSLEGVLTFFITVGLIYSLLFPLQFRLGMARGAVTFLGASVVLLGLGYGTASLAGGPAASGSSNLFPPSALIRSRVLTLIEAVGPASTITLVLFIIALVFAGSLKLSQRWYAGREF